MATRGVSRPDDIRRHNLTLVLDEIHRHGELSRAELTRQLGLSRSTVGGLVADLTELGLVQESVPSGGPRAGRPSHVVGPHEHGPYVIAVDIDIHRMTLAAVGLGGVVLGRRTAALRDSASAAREVAAGARALGTEAHGGRGPLAIGVSVPGTVGRLGDTVDFAPNLGWRGTAFGQMLAELVADQVPVVMGNDADLAVLAEHLRGNGRACENVVFLMGRTGVGAGIIVNGAILRGHDGHAGEIGHNVVDPAGPPCHCGKHGCLETFVGGTALLEFAGRDPSSHTETGDVLAAACAGDPVALGAVRRVAGSLGQAVASLVNVLNPERVLLGGSFATVLDLARDVVQQAVSAHVMDTPGRTVDLMSPGLGEDAALIGAAEIAFARLLADPLGSRPAQPLSPL